MTMQRAVGIGGRLARLCAALVRARLRPRPGAGWSGGAAVRGLTAGGEGRGGVRAVRPGGGERPAELFVGAPGRGSKAPGWRRPPAPAPPAETLVDSHSGYAT